MATNSLHLCLSENIFISPSLLKNNFTRYKIVSWWVFSLLNSLNIFIYSLHCLYIWGEIGCNSYSCFSIGKGFFLLTCFKIVFLIFEFDMLRCGWFFFCLYLFYLFFFFFSNILLSVLWASWFCGLVLDINLAGYSQSYSFKYFFSLSDPSAISILHNFYLL